MGFVVSERMKRFLEKLLKLYHFEKMRIPVRGSRDRSLPG